MAYISGICNNANPGPTLYAEIEPALTTAGFTLVDTVVISTRTHKVWKSAAVTNTANLDWYLDIGYTTTGAGTITLQCFEYYDPATDLGYRGLYTGTTSTVIDAATSSRYGATGHALETNWIGATTFTTYNRGIIASAFNYYISVTTDRIIMLLDTNPESLVYVGLYTPDPLYAAKAGAAIYPLVGFMAAPPSNIASPLAQSNSGSSPTTALTRIPPATSMLTTGWASHLHLYAPWPLLGGKHLSTSQVNYPEVAVPLILVSPPTLAAQAIGGAYGVPKDIAYMHSSTAIRGDTVVISGTTWVTTTYYLGTGYYAILLFKAI